MNTQNKQNFVIEYSVTVGSYNNEEIMFGTQEEADYIEKRFNFASAWGNDVYSAAEMSEIAEDNNGELSFDEIIEMLEDVEERPFR